MTGDTSGYRRFFNCIGFIMEDQLRGVYLRSMEEYLDYLYNRNVSEKIKLPQIKICNSNVRYHLLSFIITRRIHVAALTSRWRYEIQTYCSNQHLKSFQKHFQRYWIYWERQSVHYHVSKHYWILAQSLSIKNYFRYFSNNSLFIFQISNT